MATTTKEASAMEKLSPKSGGDSKARDIDIIRKNLAKRSFHIKFDLDNTDYQPIEKIGIGAYGVVCSAVHKKTDEKVAIKKIPCVFEALDIAKRTYREIKILRHFKHDNIIAIREILKPKESYHEFKDIYVVFDLMESDLHRIIYSQQPLTEEHICYFLYQILRGLKYIHSANVVHRDLKPSNLLVNEDCHVRIGDFGMARGVNSQREEPSHYMTQYVATRWYRAPEILLSLLEYGTAVDMWSVGCIFAEMLGRKHLFPGKDYLSQVKLVLGLLGTPSDAVIKQCQNDILRRIIRSLGHRQPMPWASLFPKASKKALDLLSKMLVINPADRITVQRALQHPFLSKYHDPDDEPICVPSFEFDFEKELFHMDRDHLREVIYKEVMDFHQPRTPTLSFSACLRPAPKADDSAVEASFPLSFKDQLQSYMSSLSQASDSQSKKPEGTESGVVQPSFHQSGVTSLSKIVTVATTAATISHEKTEVFKKPTAKQVSKKSPVSVDTTSLQLPCTGDVEMLSAQSTTSNREMEMQTPRTPMVEKQETEKEKKQGEKKAPEGKTISEDTKALVKQALLSHRQRTESCGEDDKLRPVTAAQRQREREEKRRKKKDREKMKKSHDKKGASHEPQLSDADKELLARWDAMQKVKNPANPQQQASVMHLQQSYPPTPSPPQPSGGFSPPHPGPTSTPPSILPGGLVSQGQVTVLQGQVTASQGQGTSAPHDGQMSQAGMGSVPQNQIGIGFQGQDQLTLSDKTAAGSQQHCQASYLEGHMLSLVEVSKHPSAMLHITTTQAEALKEALKLQSLSLVPPASNSRSSGDLSRYQQVPTPPQAVVGDVSHGQNMVESGSHHGAGHPVFPSAKAGTSSYNQASVNQQKFNHSSPQNGQDAGGIQIPGNRFSGTDVGSIPGNSSQAQDPQDLSEFLDRHCTDSTDAASVDNSSANFASAANVMFQSGDVKKISHQPKAEIGQGLLGGGVGGEQFSFQQLKTDGSSFSNIPDSKGFFSQQVRTSSDCRFATRQGHPSATVTPGYQDVPQSGHQPYFLPPGGGMSYTHPSQNVAGLQFGHSGSASVSQNSNQFAGFVNTGPSTQMMDTKVPISQAGFGGPVSFGLNEQSHLTQPHLLGGGEGQGLSMNDSGQNLLFQSSMQMQQGSHPQQQQQQQQLHHHQHQQQQQQLYPGMLQQQNQTASHPHHHEGQQQPTQTQMRQPGERWVPELRVSAPPQDANADLLALIKQMSKSQLDTIIPPSLSLTPRGTGGGYGVGMDLDVLMADTLDNNSMRNELSPLSSSLLADWLEMTGNISQADLDALEQDFSMTSPVAMSYPEFQPPNNEGAW